MTYQGIAMLRLYVLAALFGGGALALHECGATSPEPHAETLSVAGEPPTTTELAARIDQLELRMESRDDAIEALLWLSEQDRGERCHVQP